jgi:hypothetical protein
MFSSPNKFVRNGAAASVLISVALALSGCAAGDVEMNGALFDYLGMGKAAPAKASQAADRQGLVVPPSLDRLPEPGSGAAGAVATQVAMPVNPETKTGVNVAEQQRQQSSYCEKALMKAKLTRDVAPVQGPFGSCNPSAIQALTGSNPLETVSQAPQTASGPLGGPKR